MALVAEVLAVGLRGGGVVSSATTATASARLVSAAIPPRFRRQDVRKPTVSGAEFSTFLVFSSRGPWTAFRATGDTARVGVALAEDCSEVSADTAQVQRAHAALWD